MTHLVQKLKASAQKRADFYQTYSELRHMPRATAIDLGLFPEDAYDTAFKAVYGR